MNGVIKQKIKKHVLMTESDHLDPLVSIGKSMMSSSRKSYLCNAICMRNGTTRAHSVCLPSKRAAKKSALCPETWCKHYPDAKGKNQSPVNISPVDIKQLKTAQPLAWKYMPEHHAEILNTGYCWKVHVQGEGSDLRGGPLKGNYTLEQFHCHWGRTDDEGSEHTVDGKSYSGELHLVHWNSSKYKTFKESLKHPDGLCVLGVFLKSGKPHAEMQKIVSLLPQIVHKDGKKVAKEAINPGKFLPENSGYFTYQGSLTTPPCSECVVWIVFKDPIEVSPKQLAAFRSLSTLCCDNCDDPKCGDKGVPQCNILCNFRRPLPLEGREIRECCQ